MMKANGGSSSSFFFSSNAKPAATTTTTVGEDDDEEEHRENEETKEKKPNDFFETFYGAFLGEEANSFTRALHFLRSVSAERATLRVSEALGLAEATEGHEP